MVNKLHCAFFRWTILPGKGWLVKGTLITEGRRDKKEQRYTHLAQNIYAEKGITQGLTEYEKTILICYVTMIAAWLIEKMKMVVVVVYF